MKKDMIKKHEQEKTDLTKRHEAELASKIQESKAKEEDLNSECEKYLKSNEDLFDQVDALNNEIDELRNEQIGTLSNSNQITLAATDASSQPANSSSGAELAEEK